MLGASLEQIKEDLVKCKKDIISCMVDNFVNQNGDGSLAAMMSVFDLKSEEEFETWAEKVPALFVCYGLKNGKMVIILS